ncbi:hypothetical protein HNR42_001263 [Deinobacterium chartae]|uniref:YspA cpYpsA-related SLOG domain-containing protein n=1 Tax=Deinobacterium chartae TaxID=521158 RepID=A0A841I063_9DEIO|nr:SLOG family protein [Deinobacterium chartae]MBB6097840.1 hypothetical protein [Deinobacterium chartae]
MTTSERRLAPVLIIAGSRTIDDYAQVVAAVNESGFVFSEIVSGGDRGVDRLGERYALERDIRYRRFSASWLQGRAGVMARNEEMVRYALERGGALVMVWDGRSEGSAHLLEVARAADLPVYEKRVVPEPS